MTDDVERMHVAAPAALRDQYRDARDSLLAGFADRTELLLWQHDVIARTIGHVPDDWHRGLVADRWTVAALLADAEDREALSDYPPTEQQAKGIRLDIVTETLAPARTTALKWFWERTTDYTSEEGPVAPSKQKFLAMRPRVHELAADQRRVLCWALDVDEPGTDRPEPISDREGLMQWADDVIHATNGLVGESFTASVCKPTSDWYAALLGEPGPLLHYLLAGGLGEQDAAVLPVMNRAIREAAKSGTEYPAEEREPPKIPQG